MKNESAGGLREHSAVRYALPEIGDVILINELEYSIISGRPARQRRGVGKVLRYYGNFLYIGMYCTPFYRREECFQISDVRVGLIRYKKLREKVYVGVDSGYTYADLDVNEPHPDIDKLIITN